MPSNLLVPAAQYLRMSTEHQQYSLANQSAAIEAYALSHGFQVVRTYSDAARTGVILQHRKGLQDLLRDAVAGNQPYRAILVYDVSRWGRFQDSDEAAHYEFLCKAAGIPVHYCAETFENDNSPMSLIVKAVKRSMAAEYSREIGIKILDGQRRSASLGYKQGGVAGYGLRRLMVDGNRTPKQQLMLGQRKNLQSDRVIFVHGPAEEVQIVREIYRMLIVENRTVHSIARFLNDKGMPYIGNSKWHHHYVEDILTHPKYAGYVVFGRTTARLYSPPVRVPKSRWILTRAAHEPIIGERTFVAAQQVLQARTIRRTNEECLQALKNLLAREGRLSVTLIRASPDTPSPSAYKFRFGGLRQAYGLIGYVPDRSDGVDRRHQIIAMREALIDRILEAFSGKISVLRGRGVARSRLRLPGGLIVSIVIARAVHVWKETIRWSVTAIEAERRNVVLLARLSEGDESFLDFHVFRRMRRRGRFIVDATWLKEGIRLEDLSQLCEGAAMARRTDVRK